MIKWDLQQVFFIGSFVGFLIGVSVVALCAVAKEDDWLE